MVETPQKEGQKTEAPQIGSSSELGEFAKRTMKAIVDLEPRSDEDLKIIKRDVSELAKIWAKDGPKAAEEKFEELYKSFEVTAKANKAAEEAEKATKSTTEKGLTGVGKHVSEMGLVQAELIAVLATQIPGLKKLGAAMQKLNQFEQTLIGITGRPQVYQSFGKMIQQADEQFKSHGIEITGDAIREALKSEKVAGTIAQVKEMAAKHMEPVRNAVAMLPGGDRLANTMDTIKQLAEKNAGKSRN